MSIASKELPDKHELVVGVVSKIEKHGIYIDLKEYQNVKGYCHIGEVAGAWIRNIRNFVRLEQQVVAKVLRVTSAGQVDLSLKRVSEEYKKNKLLEYKRQNAAIAMAGLVAEKSGRTKQEIRDIIEQPFIEIYGTMYNGFEEMAMVGAEAVTTIEGFEVPEDLLKVMLEVAETSIQVNMENITVTLGLRSYASDGIDRIRKVLMTIESEAKKFKDVNSDITTLGAPKYRLHLESFDRFLLNDAYADLEKVITKTCKSQDVDFRMERK